MKTTHTRNWRATILLGACVANWIVCAVFLMQRPAGISFIEERERMRRDAGAFFINSADPQMFIAERPLYQWNKWHGGEVTWIKVVEVLNWPALAGARALGAHWTAYAGPRNIGSFRGDTWVIAWFYLLLSTAQWLLVGAAVTRFVSRRRRAASPDATLREPPEVELR